MTSIEYMKLKKNQSEYFKTAVQNLVENKIDLHFSRTKNVDDCAGYFCPCTKSLSVAIWYKDWFSVFIHEYNHYKQWKARTKLWMATEDIDFFDKFPKRKLLSMQLMEQECDKMVWQDVLEYELEDMENQIIEANAYHISYANMVDKKQFVKKAPYKIKEITKLCPKNRFFKISELNQPNAKLYKLISDECF